MCRPPGRNSLLIAAATGGRRCDRGKPVTGEGAKLRASLEVRLPDSGGVGKLRHEKRGDGADQTPYRFDGDGALIG